jgi:hypothetical protein
MPAAAAKVVESFVPFNRRYAPTIPPVVSSVDMPEEPFPGLRSNTRSLSTKGLAASSNRQYDRGWYSAAAPNTPRTPKKQSENIDSQAL